MVRLLRVPLLRSLLPRVSAPILPVTRIRPTSILTNTPRSSRPRLFSNFNAHLNNTPNSPTSPHSPPPDASITQRLKHLIKSYGWYALGVYIIFSTLDLTLAFVGINLIGAEHVAKVTDAVKSTVYDYLHTKPAEPGRDEVDPISGGAQQRGHESFYAMLLLAYTVHKTLFLPIRVGLTAWTTPRLVRWLRARGWAGGAGARRAMQETRERIRTPRK